MAIENHFEDPEGNVKQLPPTEPGEITFFPDFECGRLSRIIGVECPYHDLGGVIHVIDDEAELETLCPANLHEKFSKETQVSWLVPDGAASIEVTDRDGNCTAFIMRHSLPFTKSLN